MKIVFTNGCFDILHPGHIELLKYCKSIGDYVIVGLNSDDSIKRLKGSSRPVNTLKDRIIMLKALKYVDRVMAFEEDTPLNLIKLIQPDIIVKGGDYKKEDVVGFNIVNDTRIFRYIDGYSTTEIIRRGTES